MMRIIGIEMLIIIVIFVWAILLLREGVIYGGKRGRYDRSAACSNAFRPSSVFFEDKEGGSGGGSHLWGYIYIYRFLICSGLPRGLLGASWLPRSRFLGFQDAFFGASFFDGFSYPFLLDFWCQLGFQNPPKSMKNRCQDAFAC